MRMLKLIPAFIVVATLSACSSQNASSRLANSTTAPLNKSSSTSISQASQDEFESLVKNLDIKSKILDQYADWKGVAYRLGGNTKVVLIVPLLSSELFVINLVSNYLVQPPISNLPVPKLIVQP